MASILRRFAALSVAELRGLSITSGAATDTVQLQTWSVLNYINRRCISALRNASTSATGESLSAGDTEVLSENDKVTPEFTNRNPRNMEKMALAYKDRGWSTMYPRRNYWHKLFIKRTTRHVSAWVEHYNGHVPVEASTEEWAIKKHLYKNTDVVARRNLGRVIAQRCLEAGIEYMVCDLTEEELAAEGNKAFYDAVVEGGITFEEPRSIGDFVTKQEYLPENY